MIALLLACHHNAYELVLEKDVSAIRINGSETSGFGTSVAADVQGVLASAPAEGKVYLYDWAGEQQLEWFVNLSPDSRLFWVESEAFVWTSNHLVHLFVNGETNVVFENLSSINHCNGDWIWSTDDSVKSIRCGPEGPVESKCDLSGCTADLFGQVVNLGLDGNFYHTSNGWCWSQVDWDDENDGGLVQCEHTTKIEGSGGERLGIQLSEHWVSGTVGRQLRPPRGRVKSLDTPLSLVIEGASDALPFSISEIEDWLVIGVPTAQQNEILGAIWLVPLSSISH